MHHSGEGGGGVHLCSRGKERRKRRDGDVKINRKRKDGEREDVWRECGRMEDKEEDMME